MGVVEIEISFQRLTNIANIVNRECDPYAGEWLLFAALDPALYPTVTQSWVDSSTDREIADFLISKHEDWKEL